MKAEGQKKSQNLFENQNCVAYCNKPPEAEGAESIRVSLMKPQSKQNQQVKSTDKVCGRNKQAESKNPSCKLVTAVNGLKKLRIFTLDLLLVFFLFGHCFLLLLNGCSCLPSLLKSLFFVLTAAFTLFSGVAETSYAQD